MSTLQVSNIHFESTGNNRLQYTGSNSFVLVAAGSNAATITTTGVSFTNTNLTLANVTSTTNTFTVGTAAYFVANGNLGIGTSSPAYKLDVNGTTHISSDFYVGSNASITASGRTLNLGDGDETVSADANAGGYSYLVRESTGTIQLSARGGGAVSIIRLVGNTIGIGPYPSASLYTVANGNIGIGTANPAYPLDIATSTSQTVTRLIGPNDPNLLILSSNTSHFKSEIILGSTSLGNKWAIGCDIFANNYNGFHMYDIAASSTRMYISPTGNIGIGLTSPAYKLDVMGSSGYVVQRIGATDGSLTRLLLENTNRSWSISNYGTGASPNGTFAIADESAAAVRFVVDNAGNVGVGTTSPTYKLHVVGGTTSAFQVSGGAGSTIRNTANAGSCWYVGTNIDSYILHNESNTPMLFTTNGTERMRIDASGRVTKPYNPAFRAHGPTNTSYGNGALITCSSSDLNVGGHYSTSTGRFTAPVAGSYQFHINVYAWSNSGTASQSYALRVNNAELSSGDTMIFYCGAITGGDNQKSGSVILYLNAGDYVTLNIRTGMPAVNIYGGHTFWSGHLIG